MKNKWWEKVLLDWKRVICTCLVLALVLGTALWYAAGRQVTAFRPVRMPETVFVLDAGHGGEDGGAVSVTGVAESGINLAIALKLDALMGFYGLSCVLLRDTDTSLHDAAAKTLREKKVSDLHNRVDRVEAIQNATLVSIHQNTFPNGGYHGAQVFYAGGDLSIPLATGVQNALRTGLDPANGRVPAKIPESVYLMNHVTCPAILVECGFLSNPAEEALLLSGCYQTKLAACIAAALVCQDEAEVQS